MGVDQHKQIFQFYQEIEEYQSCKEKYEQASWIPFLEKFKGYHEGASHAFTQSYDGQYVELGSLQLEFIEATIEEATTFLVIGEKYFKGVNINKELKEGSIFESLRNVSTLFA